MAISIVVISIFVLIGIAFILKSEMFSSTYFASRLGIFGKPISIQITGVLTVLTMSLFIIGTINLFLQNYVLIVSEKGFVNNTNFTNVGPISWDDVNEIRLTKKDSNSFLLVYVKDEKKYYDKIKNPIIKLNAIIYNKFYGSSFVVETSNLQISDDELLELFSAYMKLKN